MGLVITKVSKTLLKTDALRLFLAGFFIFKKAGLLEALKSRGRNIYYQGGWKKMDYPGKLKYPHVFEPLRIKNIIYSNRLCSTTMSTVPTHVHRSSTDYGGIGIYDKSLGGVAMIGMMYHGKGGPTGYEANGADPFAKYDMDVLRESLSVVKQGGALAGFALGLGNTIDGRIYSPSGLPFARPYSRPTEVIGDREIEILLNALTEKAKKASRFGFDLIILDISNDNLVGHFMAPGFNLRKDKWGGSYANRFRLGKTVVKKVREAIGPDFVLELRISATLGVKESYPFEEMLRFLKEVRDEIDTVNIVTGMDEYHDGNVKLCPPIFEPHLLNYQVAKRIREECGVFVNVSGAIMTMQEAEKVLADGAADLVLLGRSIVADPYMPLKVLEGREDDVVPCIRCNNCYHIATEHFNTCCSVNPRIYRENRVPLHLEKSVSRKKVMIVGAGPAGIRTALSASEKGHEVHLYDDHSEAGGKLLTATRGDLKIDLRRYHEYLKVQVAKSPIHLHLDTRVGEETVREMAPDILVIAVGAEAVIPNIKGIDSPDVMRAEELLENDFNTNAEKITILGGGSVGSELALELSRLGKKVCLIEAGSRLAGNGNELYRVSLLEHILKDPNIRIMLNTTCLEIKDGKCVAGSGGKQFEIPHDLFVVSVGLKKNMDQTESLFGIVPRTYYVGDCKNVASVTEASTEGYFLGASMD